MEKRHEMHIYGADELNHSSTSKWMQVHFPGLGEVTITYETNDFIGGDAQPVFQFSFNPRIRIIDHRGNDVFLERQ